MGREDQDDQAAPDNVETLNALALTLLRTGKPAEALDAARRAMAMAPGDAGTHLHEGNALLELGWTQAGADALHRATLLAPDDGSAWYNYGRALLDLNRPGEAEAANRRAVERSPAFAPAHNNLGRALVDMGRLDEAEDAYARAVALQPDFVAADSNRMMRLLYADGPGPDDILVAHRAWAQRQAPDVGPRVFADHDRDPDRRLRIGYVSADLRRHPVGYFLERVLGAHDRAAVEVFAYSNHPGEDDTTRRLRAMTDHWRPIAGLNDTAAEALVRDDRIDILIDLSGHTAKGRLPLFARRPAPVQASWLGYPGTTGVAAIDYLIMDAATVPPGAERWCSEAVMRLPVTRFCYAPPDYAPEPASPPPRPPVFGSFNNLSKIGPRVVRLWVAVLRATPGSRLVLKWPALADPVVRERFVRLFAEAGLEPERLELRAGSDHAAMLDEYGDIDVALDPFPFCGGLTSCEALWMGVPVVTLPGQRAASRQTLAFLEALGLPELAAGSEADYVAVAAGLAAAPGRRAELRRTLRPRMAASPLCDGPGFTLGLEAGLREAWRGWCAGRPPESFDVRTTR